MRKIIGFWLGLELLVAWLLCQWLSLGMLLLSWLAAFIAGGVLIGGLGEHLRRLQQGGLAIGMSGPIARVIAGVLFIIPGSLSDLLALLLLIPATQKSISKRFAKTAAWSARGAAQGNVIEGEFAQEVDSGRRIDPPR
jgi:UPF0716 protein FxsA